MQNLALDYQLLRLTLQRPTHFLKNSYERPEIPVNKTGLQTDYL